MARAPLLQRLLGSPFGAAVLPLASVALKVTAAGSMALVFVLASRSMTPQDFGRLSVWFNALSFVSVFAALAQDGLIVRLWYEYMGRAEFGLVRGALRNGWYVTLTGACVAAVAAGAGLHFAAGAAPADAAAGAVFVLAAASILYAGTTTRNVRDVLVAGVIQELPWRFSLLAMAAVCLAQGIAMTPALFFWTAAAGLGVGILGLTLAMAARFPKEVSDAPPRMDRRRWAGLTGRLMLPAVLEATSQYAEVILIGLLLDPVTAGGFFAVQRIAAVFPMLSTGVLAYTYTRTPRLYFAGDTARLQALFTQAMIVLVVLVAGMFMTVAVAGPFLLDLFGHHYRSEYPTLLVLGVSYTITACAGTAVMNLLITGHELAYIKIQAASLAARIVLVVILVHPLGSLGAAVAFLLVSVPYAVALVSVNRRLLGADPSILAVFRRPARPA